MLAGEPTTFAGIVIPTSSPLFLAILAIHVPAGLVSVVSGAAAMLSPKGRGRHSRFGTVYFWSLAVMAATMSALSVFRWSEDYPLFALGAAAFASAWLARRAIRLQGPPAAAPHLTGMGASYVLMLTAFYVDNGKFLPGWKALSPIAYWLIPGALGVPLIVYTLLRHPLLRRRREAVPTAPRAP